MTKSIMERLKPKPMKTDYEVFMEDIEETGEIDESLGFIE